MRAFVRSLLRERHPQPEAGVTYQQTSLTKNNRFGIVDPTFLSSLTGREWELLWIPTETPLQLLAQLWPLSNLTRGGSLFPFNGHSDVKAAIPVRAGPITKGNWSINLGLRGDLVQRPDFRTRKPSPYRHRLQREEDEHVLVLRMREYWKPPSTRTSSFPARDVRSGAESASGLFVKCGYSLQPGGAMNSMWACNKRWDAISLLR